MISFEQFQEQDSTTNVDENQFVLFSETGVYMQIVEEGNGERFGTLMGMGFDVVNIGLASTPTTELAVTMEGASAVALF